MIAMEAAEERAFCVRYQWRARGVIRRGTSVGMGATRAEAEARFQREHPHAQVITTAPTAPAGNGLRMERGGA
jgi:hypothetical protein